MSLRYLHITIYTAASQINRSAELELQHSGSVSERKAVPVTRKPVTEGEMRLRSIPFPTAFKSHARLWEVRYPVRFHQSVSVSSLK